jgi:hypothetical protein
MVWRKGACSYRDSSLEYLESMMEPQFVEVLQGSRLFPAAPSPTRWSVILLPAVVAKKTGPLYILVEYGERTEMPLQSTPYRWRSARLR